MFSLILSQLPNHSQDIFTSFPILSFPDTEGVKAANRGKLPRSLTSCQLKCPLWGVPHIFQEGAFGKENLKVNMTEKQKTNPDVKNSNLMLQLLSRISYKSITHLKHIFEHNSNGMKCLQARWWRCKSCQRDAGQPFLPVKILTGQQAHPFLTKEPNLVSP